MLDGGQEVRLVVLAYTEELHEAVLEFGLIKRLLVQRGLCAVLLIMGLKYYVGLAIRLPVRLTLQENGVLN